MESVRNCKKTEPSIIALYGDFKTNRYCEHEPKDEVLLNYISEV